jgi:branched-chain amino acid transport system ATP-binding protein
MTGAASLAAATAADAPQPALLEAEGLRKSFGGVHAVQDMALRVPAGAVVAVIGPNGAGKSTLLNLLTGIFQPDAGRMRFAGTNLVGLPPYRRARLGLGRTFQRARLFRHLPVRDNVTAGFHRHHAAPAWQYLTHGAAFRRDRDRCRAEAERLLAFVGLERRMDVPAGSIAYGEQRMLEIARALAAAPRLLMLDEPAAGLTCAEVDYLVDRMAALRARGLALVVVEHNMDLVMRVADRIVAMNHGRLLGEGTPSEITADPAVVAAYLGG